MSLILSISMVLDYYKVSYSKTVGKELLICPYCEAARTKKNNKTLSIDHDKDSFICYHSGSGGGIYDLMAYIGGYYSDFGSHKERAREELLPYLSKDSSYTDFGRNQNKILKTPRNIIKDDAVNHNLDIETRHLAYSALLDNLTLSNGHRASLMKRGLNDKVIDTACYRTSPKVGLDNIVSSLLKAGIILEDVPGFYYEREKWMLMPMPNGILIPVRDGKNNIQSIQIRLDNPGQGGKYISFSSSKKTGKTSNALCHISNMYNNIIDKSTVIITEGTLKATVINMYTKIPSISIPGVNAQQHLTQVLRELKGLGVRNVLIAFDMDCYQNIGSKKTEGLQRALKRLENLLYETGYKAVILKWDPGYKGLDDYLEYVRNNSKKR